MCDYLFIGLLKTFTFNISTVMVRFKSTILLCVLHLFLVFPSFLFLDSILDSVFFCNSIFNLLFDLFVLILCCNNLGIALGFIVYNFITTYF